MVDEELTRAEEAVRKSEERYRELLASITDYIYSVRFQNGVVVDTQHGPGCLNVTGYRPQEYSEDPDLWHRMVHPDDRAAVTENVMAMTQGKVPPTIEHRIFHRDGSIRWVRNQRVPHYDATGAFSGYDGLVTDVTSRKEAEEQLTAANAQLREVLASLTKSHEELKKTQLQLIEAEKLQTVGQLAAGVAHEVKNPLAVLQMGLGYVSAHLPADDAQIVGVIREMNDAIKRADAVVGGLLKFAAPKELDLRLMEIEPLIRRALTLVRHEIKAAKIQVVTGFTPQLPRAALDAGKMQQVFVNLFTNACHAMSAGGLLSVTTQSRTLCDQEADMLGGNRAGTRLRNGDRVLVVQIADNGSGIPPEHLARVFDPYFTTKPTGKGTGLGLTVTKTIIDMHGGRIHLHNREEGGAVATLLLPTNEK